MSSDLHAALMSARRPGGDEADRFDDHVVACVLAIAAAEAEAGIPLVEATGLDGAALSALVAARFPGAVGWFPVGDGVPEISLEEELLRDLLTAHAVEVGAGRGVDGDGASGGRADAGRDGAKGGRGNAGLDFASVERANSGLDVAMVTAPGSSPPLWGRDREGGEEPLLPAMTRPASAASDATEASLASTPRTPHPVPPPQGGREPEWRGCSDIDLAPAPPLAPLLARLVARRAMRADHLWQDLGLADRSELNRMLARHFPALHAGNTGNMRWKKYFYRRLCEAEGFVLCAAPSCAVCTDFTACFGAEDGESRLARVRRAHDVARPTTIRDETTQRRVAAE
jgi:nitrogen fixation protein NifQ